MAGPILYSTNPWIAHEISMKYRGGVHFAWVSEYFDSSAAPTGTAGSAIAPSSNPKMIYENLWHDVDKEDTHSALIRGYKKTFRRLSVQWLDDGSITQEQYDEINATVTSRSWKIWRPTLYVISRDLILPTNRVLLVPAKIRAAYGPEMQVADLVRSEFDIVELKK
jgi:hypothetical protein